MEEAAAYYRHRCLDLGLDKLQWWLEEEAAEWAEEETRHMRAQTTSGSAAEGPGLELRGECGSSGRQ